MRTLEAEHADTDTRKYAYDFDYRMHGYMLRRLESQLPPGRALELGAITGNSPSCCSAGTRISRWRKARRI